MLRIAQVVDGDDLELFWPGGQSPKSDPPDTPKPIDTNAHSHSTGSLVLSVKANPQHGSRVAILIPPCGGDNLPSQRRNGYSPRLASAAARKGTSHAGGFF